MRSSKNERRRRKKTKSAESAGDAQSASAACAVSGFDADEFAERRSREKIRDFPANGRPVSSVDLRVARGGVARENSVQARRTFALLSAPAGGNAGVPAKKRNLFFGSKRGLGSEAREFFSRGGKKSGCTLRGNGGGNGGALLSPLVRSLLARAERALLLLLVVAACFFLCAQAVCCSERARIDAMTRRRADVPFPIPAVEQNSADDPAGTAGTAMLVE